MNLPIYTHVGIKAVLIAGFLLFFIPRCGAQYQYLSTLDYHTLALKQLINMPGVNRLPADNSTLDVNHKRFFFQGNATGTLPYRLYTIDIGTGKILYDPICPLVNGVSGPIYGLRYDNGTNTLYALYDSTAVTHFCSIDPVTGLIHTISLLPGFSGYTASTYDTRDHRYIAFGAAQLWSIDAASGEVLYHAATMAGVTISNPIFDGATGSIYAVCASQDLSSVTFDSISAASGTINFLANLPLMVIPYFAAAAIDEVAGKYIFVGADPPSACVENYLYVLGIGSGSILSKTLYPYARDPVSFTFDNAVEYSFDNQQEVLYVLNWQPPSSKPVIFTTSKHVICQGSADTFYISAFTGIGEVGYRWQVNGHDVGADDSFYVAGNLKDGDSVRCIRLSNLACAAPTADTSASIQVRVVPLWMPSVNLSASATNVCAGDSIYFKANSVDGGGGAAYQWLLNGVAFGPSGSVFATNTLMNGDTISCRITGSASCSAPVTSKPILIQVRQRPTIAIAGEDSVLLYGQSLRLRVTADIPVSSWQWTPVSGLDNPLLPDPLARPLVTTMYHVLATAQDGCIASAGTTIDVHHAIRMPNAFMPNGDGHNDVFRIPGYYHLTIEAFSVFNRWGGRVFFSRRSAEGWNGNYHGKRQPGGEYTWRVVYRDPATGQSVMATGVVVLVWSSK